MGTMIAEALAKLKFSALGIRCVLMIMFFRQVTVRRRLESNREGYYSWVTQILSH